MNRIEAIELLKNKLGRNDFQQSLCDQYDSRNSLSEKQWYWVEKMANEIAERRAKPNQETLVMKGIQGLMDKAHAMGIKKPKVVLDNLRLTFVNREGRNCGTIAITCDSEYGNRTFYGRINLDGKLSQTRAITEDALSQLKKLDADPQKVASEFGHMHSQCCFCNKDLSDNRSVAVGYGKTCAKNYGLPWGEKEFNIAEEPTQAPEEANHVEERDHRANQNDVEWMSIEFDAQYNWYAVYKWSTYPSNSVLAGQSRKTFLCSYDDAETAKRVYPEAQCNDYKIPAGNTFDHLPDTQDDGFFDEDDKDYEDYGSDYYKDFH